VRHRKTHAGGYVLGNLENEIKRLEMQASVFAPISMQALQKAGIRKGLRCLDVGCGSGSVTRSMAEVVGDEGHVVGVDVDEEYLRYCRRVNKNDNVEFVRDDISRTKMSEESIYDIVFSRFLFVHLKDKVAAVKAMKRLLKKGGVMIVQELDHASGSWLCYPNDRNVEALRKAYVRLIRRTGGDPLAGRKLYRLLVQQGLTAEVSCFSPCLRMGYEPLNSLGWRIMDSLKPQLLGKKIIGKREFAKTYDGLHRLAARKDAFVTYARFFSATGMK
jgi:ubiquinone/menaquinone biosynthesis C-methylase UbiE